MEQYKTWTDLKSRLNYKSENEKKEIAMKAKLTNAIVKKRKDNNIDIDELADLAKVEVTKITQMEENKYVPSFDFLMTLVVALDMEVVIK
ncbi:helix-turn-helix transcriptional regulator [Paenibacillus sp. CMAA1739]|uniref:helix-turn-helix transcriptional regulator n=1 Tax=Paenibacillus ottowii TaxID=2315729 RepID=UPI002DB75D3F|nr:helix-turn-helix transcriptional regulator [Paenibacillus sp. CMAA1739]MEC4565480.1 helix-turn-helix transcriptional regulator [Paenibacillus sp. CMAA1739]